MSDNVLVRVKGLKKYFPVLRGLAALLARKQVWVKAVDGVDFEIRRAEIFGLAGESGCGKTTTARTIIRLEEPTDGRILFNGTDISHLDRNELRPYRKRMQIIFQDPYESLNPRLNVYNTVAEPVRINLKSISKEQEQEMVYKTLELMKLVPVEEFVNRYPHELSGGQRQRVAIARAIVLNPDFIVADEPVSMLDVSIRASILNLLLKIREMFKTSILFITHDLAVAQYICERIAVMYLGKIVEIGSVDDVIESPKHPYTKALVAAVPRPEPRRERPVPVVGEPPSAVNPPSGCRYHPRCPFAKQMCSEEVPRLETAKGSHLVACHYWEEIDRKVGESGLT